jgi:hypothetical protein
MPDEGQIFDRINRLVDQERDLRERHSSAGLTEADLDQLHLVEEQLDQCWDLLRQRRARSEFGEDPSRATARNLKTVENYEQ